jgi:hypothetical protein
MILLKWSIAAVPAIIVLASVLLGLWIVVLCVIMAQTPDMPIAP